MPPRWRSWRRDLATLAALALATGACWMWVVPPFEGPDESFFYNRVRAYAEHPERSELLFYRLAAPLVRQLAPGTAVVVPEYNPAFRFVSNARGEVNRFAHERRVAPREHVRTLYAIRALVVVLSMATILAIYAIARLSLGDPRLALLVAAICLWIPQFSFVGVVGHPEAVTRLVGAAAVLIVVARATRAAPAAAVWVLGLGCMALVPFADRQAFFLVPFVAIGLALSEPTWPRRAAAAALLAIPGGLALAVVAEYTELGTELGPWAALLRNPLWPFSANASYGSTPPDGGYYAFEFVPKIFEGFWGWIGQPSILLPAWLYGVLAALTIAATIGLVIRLRRREPGEAAARQLLARRLLAIGIVLMCIPIVYGPAIAGRNLWYGRWLFAMLGPLVIALVLGLSAFVDAARRRPRLIAAAIGGAVAVGLVLWLSSSGDRVRAAIAANHYGDRARLAAACRDTLIALGCLAGAIAIVPRLPAPRRRVSPAVACLVAVGVANAVVLGAFVRPLYAPLTPDDYVAMVGRYLGAGETVRAANVYASAVKSFPDSRPLAELADAAPRLMLGGDSPASRARLWQWIARGRRLDDRDALLMLAHEAASVGPDAGWRNAGVLDTVLADVEGQPDLAEPAALLRLALDGEAPEDDPSRAPIEASRGVKLHVPMRHGEVMFEGFTVHPRGAAGTQVIVYVRPQVDAANGRLWLHAYPDGSPAFLDLEPMIRPVWKTGALTWAAYDLPPGRFIVYLGVWVGTDMGPSTPMGTIP